MSSPTAAGSNKKRPATSPLNSDNASAKKRQKSNNSPSTPDMDAVHQQLQDMQKQINKLQREKRLLEEKYHIQHSDSVPETNQLNFDEEAPCAVCQQKKPLTKDTKCGHRVCKHCCGQCAKCQGFQCTDCGVSLECNRCNIILWACRDDCAFVTMQDGAGEEKLPIPCPECDFEMEVPEMDEAMAADTDEEEEDEGYSSDIMVEGRDEYQQNEEELEEDYVDNGDDEDEENLEDHVVQEDEDDE